MTDPTAPLPHPACPLIIAAEGTPAFAFETERVEATLAVASQLEPESLPPTWIRRLAHRFADVLVQRGDLDRADIWLGTAARHLGDDPAARVDHGALLARCLGRRDDAVGARRALRDAEAALGGLDADPAHTRLQIAHAELHTRRGVFGPVIPLLEPELQRAAAFSKIDDLWRAQRLLAFAHRNRLHFARAAELYRAVADLCAAHDAPRDQSEALMTLGQCLLGAGRGDEGMVALGDARRLAPDGTLTDKDATAALIAGHMAAGESETALREARAAGMRFAEQGDDRGYLETVGLITHLHRIRGEHEAAYRLLLGLFGQVKQRFGDDATRPLLGLIDRLKSDLGDAGFEAMSARLLAEMRGRAGPTD